MVLGIPSVPVSRGNCLLPNSALPRKWVLSPSSLPQFPDPNNLINPYCALAGRPDTTPCRQRSKNHKRKCAKYVQVYNLRLYRASNMYIIKCPRPENNERKIRRATLRPKIKHYARKPSEFVNSPNAVPGVCK